MKKNNIDIIQPDDLLTRVREKVLHTPEKKNCTGDSEHIISLAEQNLRLMEINLDSMRRNIDAMNTTWLHQQPLIRSNRKVIGPLIVLMKRAARKSIFWFCWPRIEQQNRFNCAATHAMEDSIKIQKAILDELKKQR